MRKIIRIYLFRIGCFLYLIPSLLFAQANHVVVKGTISDVFHNPIAYTTIQSVGTTEGTIADSKGNYIVVIKVPAILKASFVGYKSSYRKIESKPGEDTMQVNFVLEVDSAQLLQVTIASSYKPELVTEARTLKDFDISHGRLVLLYQHAHGDQVLMYDTGNKRLGASQLPFHTDTLLRNEHSDIYFTDADSVYFLHYDYVSNRFEPFSLSKSYYSTFEPVKAYNNPYYYYEKKGFMNAGVMYWTYNLLNKKENNMYVYVNSKMLEENIQTQEDKIAMEDSFFATWSPIGHNATARGFLGSARNLSMMSLDFYSKVLVANDSIYIFNFDNDSFNVYDKENRLKRQLPILFHQKKMGISKEEIIEDDNKGRCYFTYQMNGIAYIQLLDLNTGEVLRTQSLKYPFPEKIRIMDGYAYYTCSDAADGMFERHLYKQRLE